MKVTDSRSGLGANRRHSRSYGEDLQRRHGCEDALSCFDISGSEYYLPGTDGGSGHLAQLVGADRHRRLGQAVETEQHGPIDCQGDDAGDGKAGDAETTMVGV